tara:strand:- start:2539 stop:3045 length:507 start_codon:yes stop_codon:yes gene_type:complete
MTPTTERRQSNIETYFNNFNNLKNNNNIINNIINNYPTILQNFKNKYNSLSNEVKDLCDFSDNLLKTISLLQTTVCRLKREYNELHNELHDELFQCKQKLNTVENIVQQVSETTAESDNICVICMTNPKECAYVNCGHLCACVECCNIMGSQCPICRQNGNFIKLISV